MSDLSISYGGQRLLILIVLGFLTALHWLGYVTLGGININDATQEFGYLPLQMGLVFTMHGFFLLAIKKSFRIEKGWGYRCTIGLAVAILLSAGSFYITETLFGISELSLYEPVMVSVYFAFSLVLYISPMITNTSAYET